MLVMVVGMEEALSTSAPEAVRAGMVALVVVQGATQVRVVTGTLTLPGKMVQAEGVAEEALALLAHRGP
jgi:hypothetical protein